MGEGAARGALEVHVKTLALPLDTQPNLLV